jgi:hypothetical protein
MHKVLREGVRLVGYGLRDHPIALVVIVINLIFLIAFTLMLREIAQAVERKDALLSEIASHCMK